MYVTQSDVSLEGNCGMYCKEHLCHDVLPCGSTLGHSQCVCVCVFHSIRTPCCCLAAYELYMIVRCSKPLRGFATHLHRRTKNNTATSPLKKRNSFKDLRMATLRGSAHRRGVRSAAQLGQGRCSLAAQINLYRLANLPFKQWTNRLVKVSARHFGVTP